MRKTRLSYSSLNQLHEASHQWINKQMGIPVPEYPFLTAGKQAHAIIQRHVSGEHKYPTLKHIKDKFPIVEPDVPDDHPDYWDLKEPCKFSFDIGDYEIIGYYDGLDEENGRILEIKSSSNPWSIGKFRKSMQRKLYGLSNDKIEEAVLVTCHKNIESWENDPPKVYSVPYTKKDRDEAKSWILEGIEILEGGDLTGGLDENGKCTRCFYGQNCHFL